MIDRFRLIIRIRLIVNCFFLRVERNNGDNECFHSIEYWWSLIDFKWNSFIVAHKKNEREKNSQTIEMYLSFRAAADYIKNYAQLINHLFRRISPEICSECDDRVRWSFFPTFSFCLISRFSRFHSFAYFRSNDLILFDLFHSIIYWYADEVLGYHRSSRRPFALSLLSRSINSFMGQWRTNGFT